MRHGDHTIGIQATARRAVTERDAARDSRNYWSVEAQRLRREMADGIRAGDFILDRLEAGESLHLERGADEFRLALLPDEDDGYLRLAFVSESV